MAAPWLLGGGGVHALLKPLTHPSSETESRNQQKPHSWAGLWKEEIRFNTIKWWHLETSEVVGWRTIQLTTSLCYLFGDVDKSDKPLTRLSIDLIWSYHLISGNIIPSPRMSWYCLLHVALLLSFNHRCVCVNCTSVQTVGYRQLMDFRYLIMLNHLNLICPHSKHLNNFSHCITTPKMTFSFIII